MVSFVPSLALLGAVVGSYKILQTAKTVTNEDQLMAMYPQIGRRFPSLKRRVAKWFIDYADRRGSGSTLETRAESIMAEDTGGKFKKSTRKKGGRNIKLGGSFSSIKL